MILGYAQNSVQFAYQCVCETCETILEQYLYKFRWVMTQKQLAPTLDFLQIEWILIN